MPWLKLCATARKHRQHVAQRNTRFDFGEALRTIRPRCAAHEWRLDSSFQLEQTRICKSALRFLPANFQEIAVLRGGSHR
jgi:hypothetical protein